MKQDLEVVVDANRRYVRVTDAVCDLLGYSRERLLTMSIDDVTAPSGAHTPVMFEHFVRNGKMHGAYELRRADGNRVTIEYQAEALPDGTFLARWKVLPTRSDTSNSA